MKIGGEIEVGVLLLMLNKLLRLGHRGDTGVWVGGEFEGDAGEHRNGHW